jgi:hypothetical protein
MKKGYPKQQQLSQKNIFIDCPLQNYYAINPQQTPQNEASSLQGAQDAHVLPGILATVTDMAADIPPIHLHLFPAKEASLSYNNE